MGVALDYAIAENRMSNGRCYPWRASKFKSDEVMGVREHLAEGLALISHYRMIG